MAKEGTIPVYGKFESATTKKIVADAGEIAVDTSNTNVPNTSDTVQKAIEDLYTNGGNSDSSTDNSDKASLQKVGNTPISMLDVSQWPRNVINSITPTFSNNEGELYITTGFGFDDYGIILGIKIGNNRYTLGSPSENVVYVAKDTGVSYIWVGDHFTPINVIYNVRDDKAYRLWVGTREQLDELNGDYEEDVIYLIGTSPDDYTPVTPEDTHRVTISCTNCFFRNSDRSATTSYYVNDGGEVRITFYPNNGYTMERVTVKMGGVYLDDVYNNGELYIENVTGDVEVVASAYIPITGISIIRLSTSLQEVVEQNKITLMAVLTPSNTTQNSVDWNLPESAVDFRIEKNGLYAYIQVLPTADDASVTITCSSINNPNLEPGSITLEDITYSGSGPNPPGPDEPTNPEYVDFTGEEDVKAILRAAYGSQFTNDGNLLKTSAATITGGESLFTNNTTITQFNTWEYFTQASFSVAGCENLSSVKLPVRQRFDARLGIRGTSITNLTIPEGYTEIGGTQTPIQDGTVPIQTISFPSTLTTINISFKDLTALTELDFSNTSLNTISIAKAFENLRALTTVKFPDTLTNLVTGSTFKECTNLEWLEFGANFAGSTYYLFYDAATPVPITLVFHGATPPSLVWNKTATASKQRVYKAILVPTAYASTYKAASGFSNYVNRDSTAPADVVVPSGYTNICLIDNN